MRHLLSVHCGMEWKGVISTLFLVRASVVKAARDRRVRIVLNTPDVDVVTSFIECLL